MIFVRRGRRGPDPYLEWKVRSFFLAAILALVGMAAESSLLVGLATVVLMGGFALRILPRREEGGDADGGEEGKEAPVRGREDGDADERGPRS